MTPDERRGPPPMPWRLRAPELALATLHPVDAARARAWVPREYPILQFWPGRTVGGLFAARYGPGSELEYWELIASCATVWHRGRPAAWVSHVFVDDAESLRGGRELLGVPKEMATFARETGAGERLSVTASGRPICRIRGGRPLWLWRQGVRFTALHLDARDPSRRTVSVHGNRVRGRAGVGRAEVEIPQGSPLGALGLGPALVGLRGRDVDALLGGAPFLPGRTEVASAPPGSPAAGSASR